MREGCHTHDVEVHGMAYCTNMQDVLRSGSSACTSAIYRKGKRIWLLLPVLELVDRANGNFEAPKHSKSVV